MPEHERLKQWKASLSLSSRQNVKKRNKQGEKNERKTRKESENRGCCAVSFLSWLSQKSESAKGDHKEPRAFSSGPRGLF